MDTDLLKIAQEGGSVVVCIILVVLFLRHIKELHAAFQCQIKDLNNSFQAQVKEFQVQITSVTDKVFQVAEDTT